MIISVSLLFEENLFQSDFFIYFMPFLQYFSYVGRQFPSHLSCWTHPCQTNKASYGDQIHAREVTGLEIINSNHLTMKSIIKVLIVGLQKYKLNGFQNSLATLSQMTSISGTVQKKFLTYLHKNIYLNTSLFIALLILNPNLLPLTILFVPE